MLRAVRRRRRWRHYPRRRRSDMRDVADLHPADRRSVVRFPRDIFSDLSESFQPETSIEQNHMARQGHLTSMYGYGGWKPTLPLDMNKICFVSSHHHESVARMQEPAPGWEFGQQNRENNPSYLSSGVPVDDTELLVLADLICGLKSITDPAEEPLKWAEDAAKIVFEMTVHKDKEILLPDTAEQEPEGIGIGAPSASEKDRAGGFGKTDDGDGGTRRRGSIRHEFKPFLFIFMALLSSTGMVLNPGVVVGSRRRWAAPPRHGCAVAGRG